MWPAHSRDRMLRPTQPPPEWSHLRCASSSSLSEQASSQVPPQACQQTQGTSAPPSLPHHLDLQSDVLALTYTTHSDLFKADSDPHLGTPTKRDQGALFGKKGGGGARTLAHQFASQPVGRVKLKTMWAVLRSPAF